MSKSLIDAFEVPKKHIKINNISDYDVFSDKEMLDNLRSKIIQNLIEENIPDDKDLAQYIFEAVNENIPERVAQYGGTAPRKVSADEYWDDRGIKVVARS